MRHAVSVADTKVILQSRNTLHNVRLDSGIYIPGKKNHKKYMNEVEDTTELPFVFVHYYMQVLRI